MFKHSRLAGLALLVTTSNQVFAQKLPEGLNEVTHAATFTFAERDGTCIRGAIAKMSATDITIQPFKQPSVSVQRDALLQVGQGDALLYSARSSWRDVMDTHLHPREQLVISQNNGKQVRGTSLKVTTDSISLKHGLKTTFVAKSEIASVVYLREKPATDLYNLTIEEAPWALPFYPELYYRIAGLEGRIPVKLYDSSKPENDSILCTRVLTAKPPT